MTLVICYADFFSSTYIPLYTYRFFNAILRIDTFQGCEKILKKHCYLLKIRSFLIMCFNRSLVFCETEFSRKRFRLNVIREEAGNSARREIQLYHSLLLAAFLPPRCARPQNPSMIPIRRTG